MEESFTERVERQAREVVASWQKWVEADGWDNTEYDRLADAMRALEATLNMNVY